MYIKRAIEEVFERRARTSKAAVLTGARQVGKSTMVGHVYPDIPKVNFKNPALLNAALSDPYSFLSDLERPCFIDEFQKASAIADTAKAILDESDNNFNFIFSGSQKWEMMKQLSDSMAGVVSLTELPTLSMREIKGVSFNRHFVCTDAYLEERRKEIKPYGDLWEYIHKGFYPELYKDESRTVEEYYSDYIKTYIERDVYDILKIRDSLAFYRFMISVAARTGNLLSYTNIADDVGVDVHTVKSWISVLEITDIIYILYPYRHSKLNRAISTPKIYFRDTGLAAYLMSWSNKDSLKNGAMNGAFFETFVVNEIIKSFLNEGKDYKRYLFYYRGKDKIKNKENGSKEREIDLVIEENGTVYPIEIKKDSNPTATMTEAFMVLDNIDDKIRGTGCILCQCPARIKLRDNLYALPIEYI